MKAFVDWISNHTLAVLLILGTAFAIGYVATHGKALFYKK